MTERKPRRKSALTLLNESVSSGDNIAVLSALRAELVNMLKGKDIDETFKLKLITEVKNITKLIAQLDGLNKLEDNPAQSYVDTISDLLKL